MKHFVFVILVLSLSLAGSISNSFADTGDFITSFDGTGTNGLGTAFNSPRGVAVDSLDRIIVSDYHLKIVQIYDSNGNFITIFDGTDTNGLGTAFNSPQGVAVDSLDRIIVVDNNLNLVQIFDSTGAFIFDIDGTDTNGLGTAFSAPWGVTVDSNDNIIVADSGLDLVQIFDSTGTFIHSFDGTDGAGTAFNFPFGVAVDSNDRIIVDDSILNLVQIYESDGSFITSFNGIGTNGLGTAFVAPFGLAVDNDDNILVTDIATSIVQIYDSIGAFIFDNGGSDGAGTAFSSPIGVAVDSNNRIIVVDLAFNLVQIFEGYVAEEVNQDTDGKDIPSKTPVEVDSDGNIIVVRDNNEPPVAEDAPDVDDAENKNGGGCGDCTPPTLGLTLDQRRIVDRGFSYNGNPVQVEFWHTIYPLITARVGDINIVQITVYENSGASHLDMVQFGLGAIEIGQPLNEIEVLIEVYLEVFDENNIGVEKVIIKDRDNLLDTYETIAFIDIVKCTNDSQTKECVQVILFYSYREATINNVMLVSVSDISHNTQNFYFNEGLEIVGESLNEAPTYIMQNKQTAQQTKDLTLTLTRTDKVNHIWIDKYGVEYLQVSPDRFDRLTPIPPMECTDPPLSEINVPTRSNCHFRELTHLWSVE